MRHRRGVTLIETLMAMFIFTIVTGFVFGVFAATHQLWRAGNTRLDVKFSAQQGIQRMLNEVRELAGSSGIVIDRSGPDDEIKFSPLADLDRDGTFTNSVSGAWEFDPFLSVKFLVDPATHRLLRVEKDTGTSQITTTVLANDVSALQADLVQAGQATNLVVSVNVLKAESEPGGVRTFADEAGDQVQIRNIDLGPVITFTPNFTVVNTSLMQRNNGKRFPPNSFPSQ